MLLKGEKVYLRPVSVEHAPIYTKWVSDPEVIQYTTIKPMDLKGEMEWLKSVIKNKNKEKIFNIFTKDEKKMIGNLGCHNLDNKEKNFTIGIVIGEKSEWGEGYATDAFKVIIEYLFKVKKAKKINLTVRVKNKAALQVYKKSGFKIIKKFKEFCKRGNCYHYSYWMELEP